MKTVIRLGIGVLTRNDVDHSYWAEAVQDGDRHYYRVNGITVDITEDQYRKVVKNPYLYYFSTALELHKRIERAKEGMPETAENC